MRGICNLAFQITTMAATRPLENEYAPYYHTYIGKVPQNDLPEALKDSHQKVLAFLQHIPAEKHHYRYAEGKWSIAEVLGHILDCERVFAYRALSFARNDKTPLPGFDEDAYGAENKAYKRKMSLLLEEYKCLRQSNILLFEGFSEEELQRMGTANGQGISVRALGFIISGHELHHMQVIKERYL